MLLNAYGWWKVSQITYIISLAAFGLGAVAGLGSIFLFVTGRRNKSDAPMQSAGHETISPVTTA
jgi:energy-converting hydrogenase Eha subunit G